MHVIRADEKLAAGLQPLSAHDELLPEPPTVWRRRQRRRAKEPTRRSGRFEVVPAARRPRWHTADYAGIVRVAGPRLEGLDIPIEVTIKGARTDDAPYRVFRCFLGAAIGVVNAKRPDVETSAMNRRQQAVAWLPFVGGVIVGLLAALTLYLDDPTWATARVISRSW